MSDEAALIVYDGECILCQSYARLLRLRETVGKVELLDASRATRASAHTGGRVMTSTKGCCSFTEARRIMAAMLSMRSPDSQAHHPGSIDSIARFSQAGQRQRRFIHSSSSDGA
jgi:hypothetical protein